MSSEVADLEGEVNEFKQQVRSSLFLPLGISSLKFFSSFEPFD